MIIIVDQNITRVIFLFQLKHHMSIITPATAKVELKKRGYTYRSAAPVIGRSFHWICQVVNGRATSRPVLEAIFKLPARGARPNSNRSSNELAR